MLETALTLNCIRIKVSVLNGLGNVAEPYTGLPIYIGDDRHPCLELRLLSGNPFSA